MADIEVHGLHIGRYLTNLTTLMSFIRKVMTMFPILCGYVICLDEIFVGVRFNDGSKLFANADSLMVGKRVDYESLKSRHDVCI